jgi:acetylornithine deacetylase
MAEQLHQSPEYEQARDLMATMVANSQRPGEGNQRFVDVVGEQLSDQGFSVRSVPDPELPDRSLLVVDIGNPNDEQVLAAISHSDVVGIEGQTWQHDPWELSEKDGNWLGRGVCDTHGSGVAMLLAGSRPEVVDILRDAGRRVSIIFTYDEEATSSELSMRGARMAAGLLGPEPVATANYFIAGEPTEIDGNIVPMRSHKGRWLAHFTVKVEHAGHVSDNVQNALMLGAGVVNEISQYAKVLRYGSANDEEAGIYRPPHSTAQVSAADIKRGDFSTTPDHARFTVDMRTLPDVHELRAKEISDLIRSGIQEAGVTTELEIVKDAPGSITRPDSPIVKVAELVTGQTARGFNGGDEGRIMRLQGGKEGVTLGPGELSYAHMPNEQVSVRSVLKTVDVYSRLFQSMVKLVK